MMSSTILTAVRRLGPRAWSADAIVRALRPRDDAEHRAVLAALGELIDSGVLGRVWGATAVRYRVAAPADAGVEFASTRVEAGRAA
jgi:hypothetical protein